MGWSVVVGSVGEGSIGGGCASFPSSKHDHLPEDEDVDRYLNDGADPELEGTSSGDEVARLAQISHQPRQNHGNAHSSGALPLAVPYQLRHPQSSLHQQRDHAQQLHVPRVLCKNGGDDAPEDGEDEEGEQEGLQVVPRPESRTKMTLSIVCIPIVLCCVASHPIVSKHVS
ncbi:hypothetical protein PMAYCL1PPCAC_22976 [Pristionchus mayeri]|uniref:Uncharacterized protein n=1 Tax=Pristionchus mayeri TaxID=1317129 RepID=A0AAN5CXZ0_9BILA|nr:hypothetical protein PMAYCL1PPCAC_22976 [Pristionchus mayeri]